MINTSIIKKIGKFNLQDPQYGDFKLSVFPFENNGNWINLPVGFEIWEKPLNELMSQIPQIDEVNNHYITIDSKFFSKSDFLRREGIHVDGNFCVDPNFKHATWGGIRPTWGGACFDVNTYKAVKDWELPYDIEIPIGDYITNKKGGLFCVSTEVGCQAWQGEIYGEIYEEGNCEHLRDQLIDENKVIFEKDTLYFMTSNTPHETLIIDKGKRRTFMRITLNHEYPNEVLPCMKNIFHNHEII
jgi:hypothetical protein